ncbi:hypothetical protein DV736_g3160, partial [Chaetothyriales sp. CBS 134916]
MPSRLLVRSAAFLLFSHALILLILYAWPRLPDQLPASVPSLLNTSLAIAMTAVAGRGPAFLTRRPLTFDFHLGHNLRQSAHIHAHLVSSRSLSSSARASQAMAGSAVSHISLHIAASSSGKGRKFTAELSTFDYHASDTDGLGLQKGRSIEEKRRARPDSGQDSYFAARLGPDGTATAFAIADGVGGWVDHGIDPADFSHGLCSHMANTSLQARDGTLGPRELLARAYSAIISDPEVVGGGSTACVGVADQHGRMRVANLGDSGYVHLRLGTVHHYSDPQTHAFNTPYQLSLTPPDILRQTMIFGGVMLHDGPERADLSDHMLGHGDVLILATDGVWDNLDAQDVLKTVTRVMRQAGAWKIDRSEGYVVTDKIGDLVKQGRVQSQRLCGTLQAVLAAEIVGEAKAASLDANREGPFAKAVKKEFPYERWTGGKVDDIAVLVLVPIAGDEPLKNDISIRGTLKSVDQYLNIKLDDITVLDEIKYPHLSSVKNVFIRGSVVRYVHLDRERVDVGLLEDACRREAQAAKTGAGKKGE